MKLFYGLLIALITSTNALADLSGTVDQELTFRSRDRGAEKIETIFQPRWDMDLSASIHLTAIGRVRLDAEGELGFDGGNSHIDSELRELFFDAEFAGMYWRVGKQQVVWGQADGLRVLDVINPLDFREFILPEFEDQRVALWTANIEMPLNDDWTAQLLWIPDQNYDVLPQPGTSFDFSSARIIPIAPPGIPVTLAKTARPGRVVKDSDLGLRFTAFLGGWDLSLNYLYHYQDQPVLFQHRDSSGVTITPTYERTHLLGGSFSNAFGDFTVRGEAGYSTHRFFLSDNPADVQGVAQSGELSYVLGLDYQGWRDWFASAQVFQSVIRDHHSMLVRDKVDTTATLLLRRDFFNDTLQAQTLLIQNLNDSDGLLQASLQYQWSSNIRLKVGADIFFGSSRGLYGQFDDSDRISIAVEFGF